MFSILSLLSINHVQMEPFHQREQDLSEKLFCRSSLSRRNLICKRPRKGSCVSGHPIKGRTQMDLHTWSIFLNSLSRFCYATSKSNVESQKNSDPLLYSCEVLQNDSIYSFGQKNLLYCKNKNKWTKQCELTEFFFLPFFPGKDSFPLTQRLLFSLLKTTAVKWNRLCILS